MGIIWISPTQDQLEEVLDVVVANQRYMLAERHAQRRFLVHSLHSLKSLISDTFSSTSSNLGCWFNQIRRYRSSAFTTVSSNVQNGNFH